MRVKSISTGRTGTVLRSIGMCYDVRMDDTGEVLSGGKERWRKVTTSASKYSVRSREEGRGPATVRRFSKLVDVQTYVRDRWYGADYIDGPASFHSDYATFQLSGCTLADLGHRAGSDPNALEYWNWVWKEVQ